MHLNIHKGPNTKQSINMLEDLKVKLLVASVSRVSSELTALA